VITREAVAGSNEINKFNGSKITQTLGFQYTPISESVKQTAAFFKNDLSVNHQA
jgi:hypothetical protein